MILSIIIPVYNKEKYLARCLDSILNQISNQEDNYEIVVIDDGSTDQSINIIRQYSKGKNLFSIYTQENSGVSVARNVGIEKSKGDFILFLDADDEIVDGSLNNVYDFLLTHPNIDMLITRQTRVINGSEKSVDITSLKENINYSGVSAFQSRYVRLNAGGGICRKKYLDDYNLRFPLHIKNAEDTIFFGLVQLNATSILYYNIDLYRIHINQGSASRVDETTLAIRHIGTLNEFYKIKKGINCNLEQKGIIDFLTYQLISNTIGHFILSNELTYKDAKSKIKIKDLLPINIRYIYMSRTKARIMNASFNLFYFLNYLKCKISLMRAKLLLKCTCPLT